MQLNFLEKCTEENIIGNNVFFFYVFIVYTIILLFISPHKLKISSKTTNLIELHFKNNQIIN